MSQARARVRVVCATLERWERGKEVASCERVREEGGEQRERVGLYWKFFFF